jgi:GT2 family glycosyltransferase
LVGRVLGHYAGEFRSSAEAPYAVDYISGCCLFFRREVLTDVGSLDESIFLDWEDMDFCYRMKKQGWQIFYHPGVSIIHHWEKSRQTNFRRSFVAKYESMYYFYFKTYGTLSYLVLKLILITAFSGRWILLRVLSLLDSSRNQDTDTKLLAYSDVIRLSLATSSIALKSKVSQVRVEQDYTN